jgi:hypothetical protein
LHVLYVKEPHSNGPLFGELAFYQRVAKEETSTAIYSYSFYPTCHCPHSSLVWLPLIAFSEALQGSRNFDTIKYQTPSNTKHHRQIPNTIKYQTPSNTKHHQIPNYCI